MEAAGRARAVRSGAPPHALPEDGAPRGRHGVGTEHTRGAEAGRRANVRAASRRRGMPGVGARGRRGDTVRRARALQTTGVTGMRHASFTRKT
eukprot:7340483-Prymnesium_polylepis.1